MDNSNIVDDMNQTLKGRVLLIEKACQKITINGREFKIEEPSRQRLQEYIELSSEIGKIISEKASPLIVLRKKIEDALIVGESAEQLEAYKKDFQDYVNQMPAATDIDEKNDEILRFVLYLGKEDQEWLDQLGPRQRQKIIEIAEDIYDIASIAKKAQMILNEGR